MTAASAVDLSLQRLLPAEAPPLLLRFARFWLEQRRGRSMPVFADLDPTQMPWALALVFVVDRREDGTPFYRLVGGQMERWLGGNLVNKTAHDVFKPAYAELLDRRWRRCFDEPAVCYVHSRHARRDGLSLQARRILLPVGETDPATRRLIGVTAFDRRHGAAGALEEENDEILTRWTPLADLPAT
jgi:hypothetical protein